MHMDLDVVLQEQCQISMVLRDADGSVVAERERLSNSKGSRILQNMKVLEPHKWTAETPYLYQLEIKLATATTRTRNILQVINHTVGFRKVEVRNGNTCVNGKAVMFRGVNRHDHHPRFGRAVTYDSVRKDLISMKQHNINAVRTSHYPSYPRLYDVCDETGLYVIDEADLECHGFDAAGSKAGPESYTSDNPSWKEAYLDRMRQLVSEIRIIPASLSGHWVMKPSTAKTTLPCTIGLSNATQNGWCTTSQIVKQRLQTCIRTCTPHRRILSN